MGTVLLVSDSGMWTPARHQLLQSVAAVDDVLVDLYEQMIEALSRDPRTIGRLVVASHCIREIANNLVDYLADVEGLPQYTSSSTHTQELAKAFDDLGWTASNEDVVADGPGDGAALVTVTKKLMLCVQAVVELERNTSARSRQRLSALVSGRMEDIDLPTVLLLRESLRYFMKYTHLRKGEPIDLPEQDEVLLHLERIETVILGRVGSVFERRREVESLLAIANGDEPESSGEQND